jgi:hypothetical protein
MRLTPEQADQLHRALSDKLGYLTRLQARMERVGFRPNDPLFLRVKRAHDHARSGSNGPLSGVQK